MTIPDFQTIMLPLLSRFANGEGQLVRDLVDPMADEFQLTTEEREELLQSGRQTLFRNRVAWAVTHMSKAGLLVRTGRGRYRISERGSDALSQGLTRVDMSYLNQFPEYLEFRSAKPSPTVEQPGPDTSATNGVTPSETLESSYFELRKTLAQDLLDEAKSLSPSRFEKLVVDLLVAMGYGGSETDAAHAVGRSGDEGIDGIINEDKLGLDTIYIQAKRWESVVGRPEVQAFAGSLEGQRARKGVMITTSRFSSGAIEFVGMIEKRIVLIDGEQLAQLMIDHGIGVSEVQSYTVYRIDSDYFSDE